MKKKIHIEQNALGETHFAIGNGIPKTFTTVINCKKIILSQESIGVEINATEALEKTNTIIVNGVEFQKKSEDSDERNELIRLIFHTPVSSDDGRSKEELVADLVLSTGYHKQREVCKLEAEIERLKRILELYALQYGTVVETSTT